MNSQESDWQKKIREQFDSAPYPFIPIETSPKQDRNLLYIHNLMTVFYLRNQKIIDTNGKLILDVGCGNGYTSLILASANPGAKIVGIDLSEESIKIARQRLAYHNFDQTEFHAISLEEVSSLGYEFDYINADEILYLLPDITAGLTAMKSVLKPAGIIRANLHSLLERQALYSAQKVFKMMGLMEENPGSFEIELVRETMNSLKDNVMLKAKVWTPYRSAYEEDNLVLMNLLLQGDKGFTIPDLFTVLREANLEFISMVQWRHWELIDLFQDSENLPAFLAMSLPEISLEERLHLFELLHPIHRLLDFWCGHPHSSISLTALETWSDDQWYEARVFLHPQLKTPEIKEDLINSIENHTDFNISRYISLPTKAPIMLDNMRAACLLPLWDGPSSVHDLVNHWLTIKPVNLITLEATSPDDGWLEVKKLISQLESFLYLLIEPGV